ncbi:hypothetical protein [Agrococcus sp. Marseille-P2731]|uniref:hypothetical protein n=1 Tax=Agrococcus sp. Marseille-P2731 TaxID=1841862 RepID=UPI0009F8E148|nr:hypothetical protein [Agrococcus sp. Marseille-P2731]
MTRLSGDAVTGHLGGAAALACSGVLFALFPLLRPWSDKLDTATGLAEAFGSPWWVAAHLIGAVAFVLLALGAIPLRDVHIATPGASAARAALPLLLAGVGLTLLYYGAETFALHAITDDESTILLMSEAIRSGALQLSVFVAGLLCVAAGTVTLAIAVWRGGVLPRYAAAPLATMIALYLPQFFLSPAGRIAHGLLTAAAVLWLAVALWRARTPAQRGASAPSSRG